MKDEIVGGYARPYFAKVAKRREGIRVIDGFAGPGVYEDGSRGSPLFILEAAQQHAAGRFRAVFVNNDHAHHETLEAELRRLGAGPEVVCTRSDCADVLRDLHAELAETTDTLFIYLDPFGPSATPFEMLEPFLKRSARFSTEIVIVLNITSMCRMAGSPAHHGTLTRVLGGDEWQQYLGRGRRHRDAEVAGAVETYADKFRRHGFLVGTCPIRKRRELLANFFVLSASRHEDGLLLMNDIMHNAYERFLGETSGRLPLGAADEEAEALKREIIAAVQRSPGIQRERLWLDVVTHNFRQFSGKQFRAAVQGLVDQNRVCFESSTGRLNDTTRLFLPK
jgi:three-Cys-motif partner protein